MLILSILTFLITWTMVLSTAGVRYARGTLKGANQKPSQTYLFATIMEISGLDQCMKECLFTEECLTTVYDSDLNVCYQYNNSTLDVELGIKQTAVVKEYGYVTYMGESIFITILVFWSNHSL